MEDFEVLTAVTDAENVGFHTCLSRVCQLRVRVVGKLSNISTFGVYSKEVALPIIKKRRLKSTEGMQRVSHICVSGCCR